MAAPKVRFALTLEVHLQQLKRGAQYTPKGIEEVVRLAAEASDHASMVVRRLESQYKAVSKGVTAVQPEADRAQALERLKQQLQYKHDTNNSRFQGGYTGPAIVDHKWEREQILKWEAAERTRIETEYTAAKEKQAKATAALKEVREQVKEVEERKNRASRRLASLRNHAHAIKTWYAKREQHRQQQEMLVREEMERIAVHQEARARLAAATEREAQRAAAAEARRLRRAAATPYPDLERLSKLAEL